MTARTTVPAIARKTGDAALDMAGAAADIVGGTARASGDFVRHAAPTGAALGTLTANTAALAGTAVGLADDVAKETRGCVAPAAAIVRAPLDTLASITELVFCPVTCTARTATMAINAGFDRIDRLFARTVPAPA